MLCFHRILTSIHCVMTKKHLKTAFVHSTDLLKYQDWEMNWDILYNFKYNIQEVFNGIPNRDKQVEYRLEVINYLMQRYFDGPEVIPSPSFSRYDGVFTHKYYCPRALVRAFDYAEIVISSQVDGTRILNHSYYEMALCWLVNIGYLLKKERIRFRFSDELRKMLPDNIDEIIRRV